MKLKKFIPLLIGLLTLSGCNKETVTSETYVNGEDSPYVIFQNELYDMRTHQVVSKKNKEEQPPFDYVIPEYDDHDYVFFVLTGTMPVLYGSLIAYTANAENTYFWFERGNTFSVQYTKDNFPNFEFLPGQTLDNRVSKYEYLAMREKVREIIAADSEAKFHLYINDLTVSLILDIMVQSGVNFADLNVTLLSDGTGTYSFYKDRLDNDIYSAQKSYFEEVLGEYENEENRAVNDFYINFVQPGTELNENYKLEGTARGLDRLAFMLDANYPNVNHLMQFPELLENDASSVKADRTKMLDSIGKVQPGEIFFAMSEELQTFARKSFMAGALAYSYNEETGEYYYDNDNNLKTLDEAIAYFESKFIEPSKQPVVITGTRDFKTNDITIGEQQLEFNKSYIDQTIEYYNVVRSFEFEAKYDSKTKEITLYNENNKAFAVIEAGFGEFNGKVVNKQKESYKDAKLSYRSRRLTPDENGAVFYFKPHPSCMPIKEFQYYLAEVKVETLQRRTPAELFLWLYKNVDFGGFTSSLFMSASLEQTRFFYADGPENLANPTNLLAANGAYDNAVYFKK